MLRFSTFILTSLLFGGGQAQQQDDADFQCGNLDTGKHIDIGDKNFDSVAPGLAVDNCNNESFLVPKVTHWHVFSIPAGELPRISTFPEGLVKPFVTSNTLKFDIQEDAMDGFVQGDMIEAGVNIFLPPDQMKKVLIEGVDVNVEIVNNLTSSEFEKMVIECSGVDNTVYVSSPNARVEFEGSGVDNTAIIESASGSSIELSGIDQRIQIKTGDDLDVEMSGVDQELTIEGDYNRIESSGIDTRVYVNGPTRCDNIDNSGISNSCSVTEETVTVPELSCLASSKVVNWHCSCWGWSTGAAVGGGIGFLLFLFLLCGLSCWGCYRCCGRGRRGREESAFQTPVEPNKGALVGEKQPNTVGVAGGGDLVLEAEVISDTSVDSEDHYADSQYRSNDQKTSKTSDGELPEAEIVVGRSNDRDARATRDLIAAETGVGKML